MKKGKSFLSLFLVIAVTVLFGVSCMYGVDLKGTGAAKNINLGLDLEGGVSITYQVKGDNPSQKDMDDTVYKLQKRVEQYSTEAQAYQVGDNRISIEIPGVNDANAILEELGQPGSLYFIKHKNSAGEENYTLGSSGYVLNKTIDELKESDSIVLTGSEVKTASAGQISDSTTGSKEYGVDLELTTEGAEKFKEATQEAVNNSNDTIAIYYDGELISVPKVNTVIENGKAQITGSMTYCVYDPYRWPECRTGRAEFRSSRSTAWSGSSKHKPDRRCNWSCTGMYFHVLGISSSGTCSQYGTAALYRDHTAFPECI